MTEEQKQRIEQTLSLSSRSISKDIIPSYIGKNVVMELVGNVGDPVFSGYLEKYDGRFVLVRDYNQHKSSVYSLMNKCVISPSNDLTSPESIEYSLPQKLINVNLIASITSLDDILEARKKLMEKK